MSVNVSELMENQDECLIANLQHTVGNLFHREKNLTMNQKINISLPCDQMFMTHF